MTPIQALIQIHNMCTLWNAIDRNEISRIAASGLVASANDNPAPTLTLAQQHAEELVSMLDKARSQFIVLNRTGTADELAELIAKVRPPQPPTLEEALDLLLRITSRDSIEEGARAIADARKLLDRVPK